MNERAEMTSAERADQIIQKHTEVVQRLREIDAKNGGNLAATMEAAFDAAMDRIDELRHDVVRVCLGEVSLSGPAFDYVAMWTATHTGLIRNAAEGRQAIRRAFAARLRRNEVPVQFISELRREGLLPRGRAAAA